MCRQEDEYIPEGLTLESGGFPYNLDFDFLSDIPRQNADASDSLPASFGLKVFYCSICASSLFVLCLQLIWQNECKITVLFTLAVQ